MPVMFWNKLGCEWANGSGFGRFLNYRSLVMRLPSAIQATYHSFHRGFSTLLQYQSLRDSKWTRVWRRRIFRSCLDVLVVDEVAICRVEVFILESPPCHKVKEAICGFATEIFFLPVVYECWYLVSKQEECPEVLTEIPFTNWSNGPEKRCYRMGITLDEINRGMSKRYLIGYRMYLIRYKNAG